MKTLLTVILFFTTISTFAQNVFRLNQETVDPAELKKTYDHYAGSKFSAIAHELAKRVGENPSLEGYIPNDKLARPWTHSLSLTLSQAWRFHTNYAARKEPRGKIFEILMTIVENDEVGAGRNIALGEIATRLRWGRKPVDQSLPPLKETVRRLSEIAKDKREGNFLRRMIVPILYEHGDPNKYLDLALELTSKEKSPLAIAEAFRFATPSRNSTKLTAENRAKYLNYGFSLLEEVNDKKSGHGYFIAMHLGAVAGVKPIIKGESPFKPNQKLARYDQSKGGSMAPFYFQDTVDNALNWWSQNKHKYVEQADGLNRLQR